ncbi:hypothetical protein LZ32DRAFT_688797 [Colletotrichum eremochloae]|nr:hypothetical protein LZ32DRAFT_688797 [Colletotrichum eremochloae]
MYLATDDAYGTKEVFKATSPGTNPGDGAIGYNVAFFNSKYFEDEPVAPKGQTMSWRDWFHERLGVRTHIDIRFSSSGSDSTMSLADKSKYIQNHRPDKFMGCVVEWYSLTRRGQLDDLDKGYLARERWLSRPRGPKYFIEVKTTTMSCETAFYMSKAQYQKMRDNVIAEDSDTLYVIFRVYNLGQENIGLKVYVDPEALRLAGRLKFTGDSWSVVPG